MSPDPDCVVCGHSVHGDVTCQLPRLLFGDADPRYVACGCFGEAFHTEHGVPAAFLVPADCGHPEHQMTRGGQCVSCE